MQRPTDGAAVRTAIGAIGRAAPDYSSTFYASADQVGRWCAERRLGLVVTAGAVLLVKDEGDFHRLFHVAESLAALVDALAQLPAGVWIADLVGQGDALNRLSGAYAQAGFAAHTFLARMVHAQPVGEAGDGEADVAVPADAPEVAAFLDRLLDRYAEQVPDAAELADEAAAGQLLVVRRDDGALSGMLLYVLKGRTAHLRFWHVDTDVRGQGVGRQLMAAFLARCAEASRLVLWVVGDNAPSIAIYRHYGFAADGLIDRIMILRKEAQQ